MAISGSRLSCSGMDLKFPVPENTKPIIYIGRNHPDCQANLLQVLHSLKPPIHRDLLPFLINDTFYRINKSNTEEEEGKFLGLLLIWALMARGSFVLPNAQNQLQHKVEIFKYKWHPVYKWHDIRCKTQIICKITQCPFDILHILNIYFKVQRDLVMKT